MAGSGQYWPGQLAACTSITDLKWNRITTFDYIIVIIFSTTDFKIQTYFANCLPHKGHWASLAVPLELFLLLELELLLALP